MAPLAPNSGERWKLLAFFVSTYAMAVAGTWLFLSFFSPSSERDAALYERVVRDPATGCEYVASANGTSAPRLDAEGKHEGCER